MLLCIGRVVKASYKANNSIIARICYLIAEILKGGAIISTLAIILSSQFVTHLFSLLLKRSF